MQNDTFHFSNFFGGNAARLAAENDRLREQLLQATAENVQLGETLQQIQQLATAETGELRDALKKALQRLAEMELQLAWLNKRLFGRSSERVVDEKTPLLPGLVVPETTPKPEPVKVQVQGHDRSQKAADKDTKSVPFADHLERKDLILDIPEADKLGKEFIGFDVSEMLMHRSAFYVLVIKRAKYVVPGEPELGVVMAPPLPNVLSEDSDRGHFDISVPVHVLHEKFVNHMPFYRQSEDLKREGIILSRGTMCDWADKIAFLVQPIMDRLTDLLLKSDVIHADETSARMLAKGKCQKCYLWVRKTGVGPPITLFHFSPGRGQGEAQKILGNYAGIFISDAYTGYDKLPGTRAACWAHVRRKFYEVPELDNEQRLTALKLIRIMYDNEARAADEVKDAEAARAGGELNIVVPSLVETRRKQRANSAELVEQFFALCDDIVRRRLPPTSMLVRAAVYALKQRQELSVFLSDPRVNIDNNPAENAIRPWALGRKNWLFVGNERGGEKSAIIASLVATCKDNKVDFKAWLEDVLTRLGTTRHDDIDSLLPHNWTPARN